MKMTILRVIPFLWFATFVVDAVSLGLRSEWVPMAVLAAMVVLTALGPVRMAWSIKVDSATCRVHQEPDQ